MSELCPRCYAIEIYGLYGDAKQDHCRGAVNNCGCSCKTYKPVKPINLETGEYTMLTDDSTSSAGVSPFRCIAYKPEVGAEVTEKTVIASDKDTAQNLFAAEIGVEALKDGVVIKVFPMR